MAAISFLSEIWIPLLFDRVTGSDFHHINTVGIDKVNFDNSPVTTVSLFHGEKQGGGLSRCYQSRPLKFFKRNVPVTTTCSFNQSRLESIIIFLSCVMSTLGTRYLTSSECSRCTVENCCRPQSYAKVGVAIIVHVILRVIH